MLFPYKDLTVLLVDDATPILVTIKAMLIKFGFSEKNIFTAKSAKLAIAHASSYTFDVVISDFNLGPGLNGKQLYEELTHYRYLKSTTVFILISGDNSAATIRPVVELKPDEYILKPFTANELNKRLVSAIERKRVLAPLYEAERTLNPESGLKICDELEPFYKAYFFEIAQFRGSFLTMLSMHNEAKATFEAAIVKKPTNWAKLGLANSLANLGEHQEADMIITSVLSSMPNNTFARTEAAKVNLVNSKVPHAIAHLEIASKLTPGNSERELVIANLCLAMGDYAQALGRYRTYIELNKNTYRANIYSDINLVRFMLFAYCAHSPDSDLMQAIRSHLRHIIDTGSEQIKSEIDLTLAHYAVSQRNYSAAVTLLTKISTAVPPNHFYTAYQYAWLADYLELEEGFATAIEHCKNTIKIESSQLLFTSKITLLNELCKANQNKTRWIDSQFHKLSNTDDAADQLRTYLEIHSKHPRLKEVCFHIIKLLNVTWPTQLGGLQVKDIIQRCHAIVSQLYSESDKQSMNYESIYRTALSKCNERI